MEATEGLASQQVELDSENPPGIPLSLDLATVFSLVSNREDVCSSCLSGSLQE